MRLDTGDQGMEAVPNADLQRPTRREALAIGRNIGALVLAACAGLSPTLQANPFVENLTPEETEALEKLYAALEKLDQYIENFARDVGDVDVNKMEIEGAERLELKLNAIKELMGGGLAVKVQLSEHRENFDQAVDYLRQTVMKDMVEKYAICEQRVKMITESVYTRHITALTDDNFRQEVLKSSDVYIVMVSAEWCTVCHAALPLSAKFGRKGVAGVKIGRAVLEDAERNVVNPYMRQFFKDITRGFPVYVVFIKGQPVGGMLGKPDSLEYFDWLLNTAQRKYRERLKPEIPPPQMEPDETKPDVTPGFTPTGPIIEA